MVCHVDVAPELVLQVVLIHTSLCIDALIETPQHHGKRGILQRSCNLLAPTLVVPVAEGIEVASHQVNLEVGTQNQQVGKVDSAGTASCAGNGMMNMHYHHSVDILATLPHLIPVGGIPQLDIENSVPDLLVLTATIVNKFGDGGARGSSPHAYPMVMVIG